MPLWLLLAVMVLATYRGTRLAVKDDFPPLLWIRDRLAGGGKGGWRPMTAAELMKAYAEASAAPKPPASVLDSLRVMAAPGSASVLSSLTYPEIDGIRCRFVRRAKWSPQWLADLLLCPWCASGWIAGVVTLAVDLTTSLPQPVLCGFAVWGAAALIGSRPTT